MAEKWPSFRIKDLDMESDEGFVELHRRWETYNREMQDLIATGTVHQDDDGWWVDNATGKLIGEDPRDVRPLTPEEVSEFMPMAEMETRRKAGRPSLGDKARQHVSLRLDADVIAKFKATGKGWQGRINEALKKAKIS
jgi:uncharacterized protein (DUF4415 family)